WIEVWKLATWLWRLHRKQVAETELEDFEANESSEPIIVVGDRVAALPEHTGSQRVPTYFLRGRQVEVAGLDPVFVGCSGTYQAGLLAAGGAVFAAVSAEVGYVRGRRGTIIVSDGGVKKGV